MNIDLHESFRHSIDESLAGAISAESDRSLRQHSDTCAPCRGYLSASKRVIASLSGFSFEVDPTLNARVLASLRQPAGRLQSAHPPRRQWALISLVAVALTTGGVAVDLQLGRLIASVFDGPRMPLHHDLFALWIAPSLIVLLLFPLLPLLSKANSHREERSL